MAVGSTAVWAMLRALGAQLDFPWPAMVGFTPYAAVAAWVPVVAAIATRRRAAAAVGAAAGMVLVLAVTPRALPAPASPLEDGPELRVLTANLYFGAADVGELVERIADDRVDVLAVQELDPESARRLEAVGLDDLLPHAHLLPEDGGRGSGIYSRFPLRPLGDLGEGRRMRMARAAVDVEGAAPVEVVSVHPFPPTGSDAVTEWRRALAALPPTDLDGPLRLLAGDFNATLDHAELRDVLDGGYVDAAAHVGTGLQTTWPVGRRIPPPLVLDRVLVDQRAGVLSSAAGHLPGSDHRPVLVEVRLPPG